MYMVYSHSHSKANACNTLWYYSPGYELVSKFSFFASCSHILTHTHTFICTTILCIALCVSKGVFLYKKHTYRTIYIATHLVTSYDTREQNDYTSLTRHDAFVHTQKIWETVEQVLLFCFLVLAIAFIASYEIHICLS